MTKYCPMKYGLLNNLEKFVTEDGANATPQLMKCDENECAWYCDYGDRGECAIASLPSLYDAIDQVSTDIRQK